MIATATPCIIVGSTGDPYLDQALTSGGCIICDEIFNPYETLSLEPDPTETYLSKDENAIRATKRMVTMGRQFKAHLKSVFVPVTNFVRRSMFCKSGYLPKRIRRIRCDK